MAGIIERLLPAALRMFMHGTQLQALEGFGNGLEFGSVTIWRSHCTSPKPHMYVPTA